MHKSYKYLTSSLRNCQDRETQERLVVNSDQLRETEKTRQLNATWCPGWNLSTEKGDWWKTGEIHVISVT